MEPEYTPDQITEQLCQSKESIFSGIDPQDLRRLVDKMTPATYADGDAIFIQGDEGDAMYLAVSGRIRVYLLDEHRNPVTFRIYDSYQTVGELSLLDKQPRSASAAAAVPEGADPSAPVKVLKLQREDFIAFLQEAPSAGLAMMRDLTNRVRYTTEFLERLMDAINLMLDEKYEHALQEVAVSSAADDEQIQGLVNTFLQIIRQFQKQDSPGLNHFGD